MSRTHLVRVPEGATLDELAELARSNPELRGEIFQHQNATLQFRQWLASLPPVPQPPSNGARKGVKPVLLGALAGFLVAALIAVGALATGMLQPAAGAAVGQGQIEGPGFGSPEEAATAYLEALGQLDAGAMVSTFAVESYVEHCDLEAYLEWSRSYLPNDSICPLPADSARSAAVAIRHLRVLQRAVGVVVSGFVSPSLGADASGIRFEDEADIAQFRQEIDADLDRFKSNGISEVTRVDPNTLIDDYPRFEERDRSSEALGVADSAVEFLLFSFTANGETYYFAPTAVAYDGRWFLAEMTSPATFALGLPAMGIGDPS